MRIDVRTAWKIGKTVHRAITWMFRMLGTPNQPIAERNGITYQLHLNEAIDVGIFLLGIFEPEVRKQLRKHAKPGQTWLDIGANPRDQGFGHSTIGAESISCDDWIDKNGIPRIDGIKLDVDGYETRVLRGAERLLTRDSPVIILELAPHHYIDPNEPFVAGVELLLDLGYRFTTLDGKALPSDAQALEVIVPSGTLLNVIARKPQSTV